MPIFLKSLKKFFWNAERLEGSFQNNWKSPSDAFIQRASKKFPEPRKHLFLVIYVNSSLCKLCAPYRLF